MKPKDLAAIRQLNMFTHMHDDTFDQLMNASFLQEFSRCVTVIHQNEVVNFLHILMEGTVEVFASVKGRESTLDIVKPVGFFILAAVFNRGGCMQSARMLADSIVMKIPAQGMRKAVENDSFFMQAVMCELAYCYDKTAGELKNHKLRTSGERLAYWLLMLRDAQKRGDYVQLPFGKRVLASYLGMTPENLSRSFSLLSHHGIKVAGSRIIFVDMKKLLQFAGLDAQAGRSER